VAAVEALLPVLNADRDLAAFAGQTAMLASSARSFDSFTWSPRRVV
jgi:hypothetical protein